MKKKSGSRTWRIITRIFNFRYWIDWDRVKSYYLVLKAAIKNIFIVQDYKASESFAEAKTRMQLSDSELQSRQKGLLRLSIIMLCMAILIFAYAIYQLYSFNFFAFFLSLVVMMLGMALAFRYHFWYFQIKERKLGCSISEWFWLGLMGGKR